MKKDIILQKDIFLMLKKQVDNNEILEYCLKESNKSSPSCGLFLGMYHFSIGDNEISTKFLEIPLDSRLKGEALYVIARIAITNNNYNDALKLLDDSKNAGCGRSYYWLGMLYQYGLGIEANNKKALYFFNQGRKMGYVVCERAYHYFTAKENLVKKIISMTNTASFLIKVFIISYKNIMDERLSDYPNWKQWEHRGLLYPQVT